MDLQNRIALVTGGTKGIGAAAAIRLAEGGSDVALAARHDDDSTRRTLAAIEATGRRGVFIPADMAIPEQVNGCVEETRDKLGEVDILVHSAGGPIAGKLLEIEPEDWYRGFEVHVHSAFHLCRAVVPAMKGKREGAIILISSVAGIRGVPAVIGYQTVKGALPQMTRALARELAEDNIRANCVAPGIIRTDFHKNMPEEVKQHNIGNRIPLHREGTPEQVAQMILELITNDYITGETVTVDGGLTMRIA
ncbi:MAG: SDR family oxidoreductase [Candidatus Omnitrophica bacterium]|nr:SDR family oxidoreductase [Candidatus Omnitrophota bacterium]